VVSIQVASALGCRCFIAMPDDAAIEKANILTAMGEAAMCKHTPYLYVMRAGYIAD
jgi:cysteine synthase